MTVEAASRYVDITREEFEDWLDSLGKRWKRKRGTVGVYRIRLSDAVAIEVSSSLGGGDSNMGRGRASMQVRLVSVITNHTLNKKAQGQKYFKRTQNWRRNLRKGVDRMEQAYRRASAFYEAIAEIEDRKAYKRDVLGIIESIDGWEANPDLVDLHNKVGRGGILTKKQLAEVRQMAINPGATTSQSTLTEAQEAFIERLRELWKAARAAGDDWTMEFAADIGQKLTGNSNYRLSERQREVLLDKLKRYHV